MRVTRSVVFLAWFFVIFIFGCVNVEKKWELVKETDNIESYEAFVAKYPKSKVAIEAAWEIAKRKNSIVSYGSFMVEYPKSKWYPEARIKTVELISRFDRNWLMLKEGMSLDEVDDLIGPLDPRLKKVVTKHVSESNGLIGKLSQFTPTSSSLKVNDELMTLTFEMGKLKEWQNSDFLKKLRVVAAFDLSK